MPPSNPYVLIAISNLGRAAFFRQAVLDTLRLDSTIVRDGDEALQEMARRGPPAVLIVDLSLPRVDGFAVVRRIRRQAADNDTRVIVVAAHESLLTAARELSSSLSISSILPLSVDERMLNEALCAPPPAPRLPLSPPASSAFRGPGLDIDEVMDRAVMDARRRFQLPACIGYLRNGDQEHLTFQAATRSPEPVVALGEADFRFLRQVADAADPLVIPQIEDHPVFARQFAGSDRSIRGFAAVPMLTSREHVRGALCVLDTKPLALAATDVDALAQFGRQLGQEVDRALASVSTPPPAPTAARPQIAISAFDVNVEDVKALQHLASTDPLTGLANRRGGEKHIANEISRAKRERRPLSCILLDIDRFKQVNDTFGHQAGDQLLRDISSLLRRTVRAYDILVRWGGEEFLLVLPGVDLDTARMLAERVRAAVETLDTHGIGRVTISAGAAKFESDYDFAATLRTADQRLYEAKAAGRNRVV